MREWLKALGPYIAAVLSAAITFAIFGTTDRTSALERLSRVEQRVTDLQGNIHDQLDRIEKDVRDIRNRIDTQKDK